MLTQSPDSFIAVARLIAKGNSESASDPPAWLVPALEHFRDFVGSKRSSYEDYQRAWKHTEEMRWAADVLIKDLQRIFAGVSSPDVTNWIEVLTKIKNLYRERSHTGGGQRPYAQRMMCAAVVVEAWKLIHGNVEPRSKDVLVACAEYWQACDQEERDAENWWRDTEAVVANPYEVVHDILTLYARS